MKIYVNLDESCILFNVCFRNSCQKVQISLVFLFLFSILILDFPRCSSLEKIFLLQCFNLKSTITVLKPFCVVVKCEGEEPLYHLKIKTQSFYRPVSLGWKLHKFFSIRIAFSYPERDR